jgi:outer membrane receptor protein involved in Fe transport
MKKMIFLVPLFIAAPLLSVEREFELMSLEELMQVEIFGSTLTPEALTVVPSSVTVFTHEEIRRMGLDTLDELMALVPGFQTYRSSGSGMHYTYSSRGRHIGTSASEILVMMDGQRLDEPRTSGSAGIGLKFPLALIERVEFIRGPGAAVYGSNAMMGVVNIVTRKDANDAGISYGSFNRRQAYIAASHRMGDLVLDLYGQAEADDGDDYNLQDTFSFNRIDTKDPRELATLNLRLRWKNTEIGMLHNRAETEDFYNLGTTNNDFNWADAKYSSFFLKQEFDWSSVASWVRFSYRRSTLRMSSQQTPEGALAAVSYPSSTDPLLATFVLDDYSEAGVQIHNDWEINPESSLQFGAEYRHIDAPEAIAKNNFDMGDLASWSFPIRYYGELLPTTPVQAESSRDIIGVYAQYQRQLFDRTSLTLGLRYDDFSGIGSQLSPRFGLVQELNEHNYLKLLYGEAFRAPAEDELNLLNNPLFLGNPDLKPEIAKTWELIWVGQWAHSSIALGYFESRYDDSVVAVSIGVGGIRQYQNVPLEPTKGFELELSHELSENWLVRASYTHLGEKPEPTYRDTDQLASLMVNYQRGKWNANLIATYDGEREMPLGGDESNRLILNGYWLAFGKLSYSFNQSWQTFVQAKNLLDEDYLTPSEHDILNEGVQNRGREILVGVIWDF